MSGITQSVCFLICIEKISREPYDELSHCDIGYKFNPTQKTCDFSCPVGSHMSQFENQCLKNECDCPNGEIDEIKTCLTHQSISCKSCDQFYHIESYGDPAKNRFQCSENQCICENGNSVSNSSCIIHSSDQCESCDSDYNLNWKCPNDFLDSEFCKCQEQSDRPNRV